MVRNDILQEVKPERRQRREHCAFVGNRVWQHNVESGNPIGDHDQQLVFDRINVPDLAASEKLDTRDISLTDYVDSLASFYWIMLSTRVELLLMTKGVCDGTPHYQHELNRCQALTARTINFVESFFA